MVVPVPVVLQEDDVKTLPKDVFAQVDALGAPRLVEYWEQDPCAPRRLRATRTDAGAAPMRDGGDGEAARRRGDYGVKIEAKFTVGEYEIVILSAKDSTGLDDLAATQKLQDPRRAPSRCCGRTSRAGSKFFVAKVDPKKVQFDERAGAAVAAALPLRQRGVRAADPARAGELRRARRT